MGMVRQWQEIDTGARYSDSYMDALPDFVKLAEAFGHVGLRAEKPDDLDDVILQMIEGAEARDRRLPRQQAGELLPDDFRWANRTTNMIFGDELSNADITFAVIREARPWCRKFVPRHARARLPARRSGRQ